MAHKAMVDGASVELSGGRALAEATVYGIKKGRCMADGTIYDISFEKVHKVTVSGSPDYDYAYFKYGSTKYSKVQTFEFTSNGEIELTIYIGENRSGGASMASNAYVKVNGETVQRGIGSYIFTTDAENISIDFSERDHTADADTIFWCAEITTS